MTYNLMNQHGATLHDKALNGLYYFQLNLDALCEKLGVPYLSEYVDDYAFRQEMLASGDYDDLIEEIGGDPNDLLDPEAWHDPAALLALRFNSRSREGSDLQAEAGHEEILYALAAAERHAASNLDPVQAVAQLGEGWVAEEALAIAVYCALVASDLRAGVILAVNHDGDSDSTGAIAGNLLGALHGVQAIPPAWLTPLELREVIDAVARDLYATRDGDKNDARLRERYPV